LDRGEVTSGQRTRNGHEDDQSDDRDYDYHTTTTVKVKVSGWRKRIRATPLHYVADDGGN
jgi:hypothetical protein